MTVHQLKTRSPAEAALIETLLPETLLPEAMLSLALLSEALLPDANAEALLSDAMAEARAEAGKTASLPRNVPGKTRIVK